MDDGSTDGTFDWLGARATARPLRRLRQQNRGPAAARNRGVAAAAGAVVAFLGDDTVPEPGWLAAHWAAHGQLPGRAPAGGDRLHRLASADAVDSVPALHQRAGAAVRLRPDPRPRERPVQLLLHLESLAAAGAAARGAVRRELSASGLGGHRGFASGSSGAACAWSTSRRRVSSTTIRPISGVSARARSAPATAPSSSRASIRSSRAFSGSVRPAPDRSRPGCTSCAGSAWSALCNSFP